jgi:hypothetical protein
MYIYVYVNMDVCLYGCMYVCMSVCMSEGVCVCRFIFISSFVLIFLFLFIFIFIVICWFQMENGSPGACLNPFTVCSSCKRKFVVFPLVDEETNGGYPFANELNG